MKISVAGSWLTFAIATALLMALAPQDVLSVPQQTATINDKDVKVLDWQELKYPPVALATHTEGLVVVRLDLDAKGTPTNAVAISGRQELIEASLDNAKKWRFQPDPENAVVLVYRFTILQDLCKSANTQFTFHAPNFVSVTTCETPLNW